MSGTVVVTRDLAGAKEKDWMKVRLDGVTGEKVKGRSAVEVPTEPGAHKVQITLGGFRSNTVGVEVREGGRHNLRVLPGVLGGLLQVPLLGLLPVLIGAAWPGSVYRLDAG